MDLMIPGITLLAGVTAITALYMFLSNELGRPATAPSPDPEEQAIRRQRLVLAFMSSGVAIACVTMICLTVQLSSLQNNQMQKADAPTHDAKVEQGAAPATAPGVDSKVAPISVKKP